jgi:monofunctional biosynthetic peptidoglycan transglycosylase
MGPRQLRSWIRLIVFAALALLALPYVLTFIYRTGEPVSTLMLWRRLTGAPMERSWVSIDTVSPALVRAVIASEDAKFCTHRGIDWDSLNEAIADAQEGEVTGGGSTITQQVAKNLFLWPGRSYVRKALEVPLALWIDVVLPKRRVMELYLNVAEWGPSGQFGAEAGARHAFGKSAAQLTPAEAARLAAILPNPVTRNARAPGPGVRRISATVAARAPQAETGCI